jgi:hypothetical protein
MTTEVRYQCQYCEREFTKETTLSAHLCEPKRRHQARGEKGVQLGLQAYLKFYEYSQGSARLKTWDDFAKSPYYRAFVKFGRYCQSSYVINPVRFMDWLLKNNKKIDYWCQDTNYNEYLTEYLQLEAVADALSRSIEYSIDWSEKNSAQPCDCLRYGNRNVLCHAVATGRISPWAIYNCASGQEFLNELSSEQVAMIWPYINADRWQQRFANYRADQEYAQEILKQAGW